MAKRDRNRFLQKRNAKLAKRKAKAARRQREPGLPEIVPYTGNKYRSTKYVEVVFQTELGIYEAYRISDRTPTDADVVEVLHELIDRLRRGEIEKLLASPVDRQDGVKTEHAPAEGIVSWSIQSHWRMLFATRPRLVADDMIGVLRTILGSIDVWKTAGRESRGYLAYIEGFLTKQLGVSVRKIAPDELGEFQVVDDDADDALENRLRTLARRWHDYHDSQARTEFQKQAAYEIHSGGADQIAAICQRMLGEATLPAIAQDLRDIAVTAHQATANLP